MSVLKHYFHQAATTFVTVVVEVLSLDRDGPCIHQANLFQGIVIPHRPPLKQPHRDENTKGIQEDFLYRLNLCKCPGGTSCRRSLQAMHQSHISVAMLNLARSHKDAVAPMDLYLHLAPSCNWSASEVSAPSESWAQQRQEWSLQFESFL